MRRSSGNLRKRRNKVLSVVAELDGDAEIVLAVGDGELRYRVSAIEIVMPTDVGVLADTAVPSITLVTCYPFYFVGHAPQRFIVKASRVVEEKPLIAAR